MRCARPSFLTCLLLLGAISDGLPVRAQSVAPVPPTTTGSTSGHWAFRKPVRPAVPALPASVPNRNEVDAFVWEKLKTHGLTLSAAAAPATLVRRVALDLTGLPPSREEVDRFLADPSPRAYADLVEGYLQSPRFGERWARVWLDLARYADSKGYGSDSLRPYMWRYRDWVINAFNRNLRFDQFTLEQLAGDLLPNPDLEQRLATGFHRNSMANDEGGTNDEEFRVAAVKDRVDTTMQVWMGLTFGCAQCHSHKYDPITQKDYYAVFALFNQTADADLEDDSPRWRAPTPEQAAELRALNAELEPLRAERDRYDDRYTPERLAWEKRTREADASWKPLVPSTLLALGGTDLISAPDGTVEARGEETVTNRYRLEFASVPEPLTALRLELLPMSTPKGQVLGRGARGQATVSELQVFAQPEKVQLPVARYVRVELSGRRRVLSLGEVQVMSDGVNVAPKGRASQSSTQGNRSASLAVDAILNGNPESRSVAETLVSTDPWWEVDLGQEWSIDRVVLWNRTDGDQGDELHDYRVRLLDGRRSEVWTNRYERAPNPVQRIDFTGVRMARLETGSATRADEGSSVQAVVDRDLNSSWTVSGGLNQPQEAVFPLDEPLRVRPGEKVVVIVEQASRDRSSLARFRLARSAHGGPLFALPAEVREALKIRPEERQAGQHQATAAFYWKFTPAYAAMQDKIRPVEERLAKVESDVLRAPVMEELPPELRRTTHLQIKGDFLSPGEPVGPNIPAIFGALPVGVPTNRLGLARWLVDPANPLTARVTVNRLWSVLFSRGLVETQEDFGTQGSPPSHPELLDWLATEFVRVGWDIKAMLRLLTHSATYQASSDVSALAEAKDPRNIWLSHFPRARLEAEMIRDQALAVGGLLSGKVLGPSVFPWQPANLWQAAFDAGTTWTMSTGEDRHRRSLYTFWRRSRPYPSLSSFNAPTREVCTLRRPVSNTPLQALVTLNDPVFVEAAQAFGRRILAEGGNTAAERARWAWRTATARWPTEPELETMLCLYQQAQLEYQRHEAAARQFIADPEPTLVGRYPVAETAAWTVVANILLNLDLVLTKG